MSGRDCCPSPSGDSHGYLLLWACLAIAAVLALAVALLDDVFSIAGLKYSFFMGGPEQLTLPFLVRLVTWGGLLELAVTINAAMDYYQGQRYESRAWAWVLSHTTLVGRIWSAVVWALPWVGRGIAADFRLGLDLIRLGQSLSGQWWLKLQKVTPTEPVEAEFKGRIIEAAPYRFTTSEDATGATSPDAA